MNGSHRREAPEDYPGAGGVLTDSQPTPAPHTVGADWGEDPGDGSTRTRAHVRARIPHPPAVPALLRTLFVGDTPWPFGETLPRMRQRLDYTLHGEWCDPKATKLRWAVLLLFTVPIACPIAAGIDLLDWVAFPPGRLLIAVLLTWLLAANL